MFFASACERDRLCSAAPRLDRVPRDHRALARRLRRCEGSSGRDDDERDRLVRPGVRGSGPKKCGRNSTRAERALCDVLGRPHPLRRHVSRPVVRALERGKREPERPGRGHRGSRRARDQARVCVAANSNLEVAEGSLALVPLTDFSRRSAHRRRPCARPSDRLLTKISSSSCHPPHGQSPAATRWSMCDDRWS